MTFSAQLHLRRCRVGARPRTDGAPFIGNGSRIQIGDDFVLTSRPVQSHLVAGEKGRLEIGHGVVIGQGAAIAAHTLIRIGDRTRLGDFVVIADTDFHVPGDRDAAPPTAPVVIGADVRIGSRVTILRGATLGDGCEVAAGSVVSGPVPARARVAGVPARPVVPANVPRADAGSAAGGVVARVVRAALGLSADPPQDAGPGQLAGWDSLGSLKLLLALEEEFGITLQEHAVAGAKSVADLAAAVEHARARAGSDR